MIGMENMKSTKATTSPTKGEPSWRKAGPNEPAAPQPAARAADQTRDAPSSTSADAVVVGSDGRSDSSVGPDDVLLGRGGATNAHSGNVRFRRIIAQHQQEYLKARKREKVGIARRIVGIVQSNGGRFLKRTDNAQNWVQVTDKRAQEKASQALREGLDVRNNTIRPSKQIKEMRPTMTTTMKRQGVQVPEGKTVNITIPQFSPNSAVSYPAGAYLSVPGLKMMYPVVLHNQPSPYITQNDAKNKHEV